MMLRRDWARGPPRCRVKTRALDRSHMEVLP